MSALQLQAIANVSAEQWADTPLMHDAYSSVNLWERGSVRRSMHFAMLCADYAISTEMASEILAIMDGNS